MRKLVCLVTAAVIMAACGKKGPLIYPDMLVPNAPADVVAQQRGNVMKLSFVLPSRDRAGRSITGLAGVKILKRDEPVGQAPGCSACASDFALFRNLNLNPLPSDAQRSGNLVQLLDGDVQIGRSYSYLVSVFTGDQQSGVTSTTVKADMVTPPLPPVLQVVSQPTEINLEFVSLPPQEGSLEGYNIYRRIVTEKAFSLLSLNREPLPGNTYKDQGLERSVTYVYVVRSVVRTSGGGIVESALSNEMEGRLKDDE
jgi:predicted small lipoprotein YifL